MERLVDGAVELGARAAEVVELLGAVGNASLPAGEVTHGPRTGLQRLPRHLRRRAMSHNLKRLPRAARTAAAAAQTAQSNHRAKPPSRYHRRRASNLLKEYVRRQAKARWLETHIWHAKRFHLSRDLWGYHLPDRSTQRGYRAAFRDAQRHCLVQDTSYLVCLQLQGPWPLIQARLASMCSPSLGPTFAFAHARKTGALTSLVLYRPQQFPFGCIGPAHFHSQPLGDGTSARLWLWLHPAIWQEVFSSLKEVLHLTLQPQTESPAIAAESLNVHLASQAAPSQHWVGEDSQIRVAVLKDSLVRFRLTGALALAVLANVCRPSGETSSDAGRLWARLRQSAPSQLSPNAVLPITFIDPRTHRPTAKTLPQPIQPSKAKAPTGEEIASVLAASTFWSAEARQKMSESKESDAKLNEKKRTSRSGLDFLSGEGGGSGAAGSEVGGLVLVWSGTEVELVGPKGWGMPLWLGLVYSGGRAAGLREAVRLDWEAGRPHFPDDWPDTAAGAAAAARTEALLASTHARKPTNRRPNYARLHVPAPFRPAWARLLAKPSTTASSNSAQPFPDGPDQFYVLRDRKLLRGLRQWLGGKAAPPDLSAHPAALLSVSLTALKGGRPKFPAAIYLPKDGDDKLDVLKETLPPKAKAASKSDKEEAVIENGELGDELSLESEGLGAEVSLVEEEEVSLDSLVPDRRGEREALRLEKRRKRRQAYRVRVAERKLGVRPPPEKRPRTEGPAAAAAEERDVRLGADRELVGLLSRADASLSRGRGFGLGLVSAQRLVQWAQSSGLPPSRLLFRNSTTALYRFARLHIL